MANVLYDKGRERFLTARLDWLTVNIRAVLVDTASYTLNVSTHEYLADIPPVARISTSGVFTNKSATGGAADADNVTFTAVSGPSIEAVVLFADTGTEATSPLIGYFDSAAGLPITPNGGDIILQWDDGVNRIFRL